MSVLEAWAPGAPFPVYRLDQMMAKQQQVVIVGGGVIGLLTAYNLASEGQGVTLLERGGLGQESSWAGGGIVSPLYPWRYTPAVTALAHWSQDFYPQLAQRLFEHYRLNEQCLLSQLGLPLALLPSSRQQQYLGSVLLHLSLQAD